ncbi:hypothetical protein J4416_02590 [Candidatus Pacearchaeota archaeon]|nr:hypothetical protein [Candidatus Pacearchaeota archaeon]
MNDLSLNVDNFNYESTYTSAVCSGNTCQDYLFTCINGETVNSRAISGLVTFSDDWVDLRTEGKEC